MRNEEFALLYCQYLDANNVGGILTEESYTYEELEHATKDLFFAGYIDGPFDPITKVRGPYHLTDKGRKWYLSRVNLLSQ